MKFTLLLPAALAAALLAGPARAAFHLIEIEQVIGGVAGDTTAQAVQLKMRGAGNNVLSGTVRLIVRDAAGGAGACTPPNCVVLSTLGAGINSGACDSPLPANGEILLATDAFVNLTTPAAVRDFAMAPIPASFLPGGSLTFENAAGTLIYWRVSWGAYTGVGTTTLDNGDGNVNPPEDGPLPSNGTQALRFPAGCPAATDNMGQYALTAGTAIFENNDGGQFTVNAPITAVPVLPGWGWAVLAAALVAAGAEVARRRLA